MPQKRAATPLLVALLALSALSGPAWSGDWSSTNVQLMSGSGFRLGASQRTTFTVEHANGWDYGSNFLFVDVVDRPDIGTTFYGEAYPSLSLSKLSGRDLSSGSLSDVAVKAGINAGSEPAGSPFRAWLGGLAFNFKVPAFTVLQLDVLAYHVEGVSSTGVQITPVWDARFNAGPVPLRFRGFLDYISAEGTGASETVLTHPQLLMDASHFWGKPGQLYLGLEFIYWYNKFGIKGVTESVPQAMLLWSL